MRRKLATEERQKLVELRQKGLTFAEIGRQLNISRERVRQICMEELEKGGTHLISPDKDEIPPDIKKLLLAKYPEFDNSWSEELKIKWLEGFIKIIER